MAANRRLPVLKGKKMDPLNMPLIVSVSQTSPFMPSEWVVRSEKEMFFITFRDGVLTCREGSKFAGDIRVTITFPSRKHSSCMQTEEMIELLKFKMNHYEKAA